MANSRIILGIDIGSTKIATVVGETHTTRGLVLRGLRVVPTEAITRGTVRDLNQAAKDIDDCYSGVMYSSGLATDQVYVGITGRDLASINRSAAVEITHPEGEVEAEDVDLVISHSLPQQLPAGQQIVHSMVREFTLDGIRTNRSPVGMIGQRLGVETHVVIGSTSQIANLERALSRVDLAVRSYVFNLISAGEAVLSAEDRNAGCVLIDFGGGTTNVGVFHGGTLCFSRCIPLGGQNFDIDLKQGLGVSFEEAQRLKKSYGKAWIDPDNEELEDFIDIKFYGRREYDKIKRRRIFEIMQPRTEEILEHIIDALNDSGELARIAGGVIIVGGSSQMRQLRRYLQKYLQRPVRVGLPTGIGHLLDEYRTPAFAATLGLLLYGAKHEQTIQNGDNSFVGEVITALQEMWGKLFPTREK
ncbi:cell division protein FtsA [bacterium]|nr:cell division protein FtsA [bacterium]